MPDEARTIDLGAGRSTTTTRPVLELAEFQAQAAAAGWRFVCPRCGHVATPDDFRSLGADAQLAAQECIGRAQHPDPTDEWWDAVKMGEQQPCDWVAYGLFGTLGNGLLIQFPDGTVSEAFAIATP